MRGLVVAGLLLVAGVGALMAGASGAGGQASQPVSAELFLPGLVSTPLDELNAIFTPDGKELYFTLNTVDNSLGTIVLSRLRNGRWSAPEVASFSGQYSDYDPAITADGKRLFFISNRPKGAPRHDQNDFDIYVVERTGDGWGPPERLGEPINSAGPEYYPSVAADGTLYFSARREGGKGSFDLYRSRLVDGKYGPLENLGAEVNGGGAEIDSQIAPDQSYLIFAAYGRPDELGGGDLYISHNDGGRWTPARNLGPVVNSEAREYCPSVSPDGKYFYWTSKRGFSTGALSRRLSVGELRDSLTSIRNGLGNVYRIPLGAVTAVR